MKRPIFLISITPYDDSAVTHLSLLKTRFLETDLPLDNHDGLILTSKQAVEAVERIDPAWKKLPVLCVGKATQKKAEALGAVVLERSDGYGAGLYDIVKKRYAARKWLYARPKVVASDFARRLRDDNISVDETVVYETVCDARNTAAEIPADAVLVFTSPSALKCFRSRFELKNSHSLVVIGKTTAAAIGEHPDVHLADEPGVAACIALAKKIAAKRK